MPTFAFVKNGIVRHIEFVDPNFEKWIALLRSGVLLKETTRYNVMPGDLFIDGNFYKKNLEDGSTTLLEEGSYTHPNSIRFAGIMDGEIVGQWGKTTDLFASQEEVNNFIDTVVSSEVIEIGQEQESLVESGWLYNGVSFTNPNSI